MGHAVALRALALASLCLSSVVDGYTPFRRPEFHGAPEEISLSSRQESPNPKPLECFQVASPVLTDDGLVSGSHEFETANGYNAPSCQTVLMDYHFANSYGNPFVG